jgi:hypothetical protein
MFGKRMDLRKWIGIVTDLIDVRKKKLYKKSEKFCFVVIFLFE